jgi:hypothetical protein
MSEFIYDLVRFLVGGVIVGLLSIYIKPYVDKLLGKISSSYKKRSEGKIEKRIDEIFKITMDDRKLIIYLHNIKMKQTKTS